MQTPSPDAAETAALPHSTAASPATPAAATAADVLVAAADAATETAPAETVTLEPRYWVPLGVSLLGPLLLPLLPLWSPARWLRLVFEPEALVVRRQDQEIRRFPYSDWISWKLFWPSLPILFYFRERRSIHFLPMLFDATALRQLLEQRVPRG
jgi:hypothetical protein